MPKRNPITDHYGTEIKVQPLMGSIGPCVDLERSWDQRVGDGPYSDWIERSSFDRLTPEQAVELGEWLIESAGAEATEPRADILDAAIDEYLEDRAQGGRDNESILLRGQSDAVKAGKGKHG